jgi:D-alanyl-D-alanine carboxypeptidase
MKTLLSKIGLCSLAVLNLFSCSGGSSTEPDTTLAAELQSALDSTFAACDGIGVSAAVLLPDHDVWLGVGGVSHGTTPISSNMIFNVASVSKSYTAALILQLYDEGVLSLDDSLHEWIQSYPNVDGDITIRQLLNHTSGIFNYTEHPHYEDTLRADLARTWSPDEVLSTLVLESYFPPGTAYHYSNTNYVILGKIITEATGLSLSGAMRSRLFDPLGLGSTFMFPETIVGAVPHQWYDFDGDGVLDDISQLSMNALFSMDGGAGAVFATAEDLVEWTDALLHERTVVSQSALAQMLDFYPLGIGVGYGFGIATVLDFLPGVEAIGVDGGNPGWGARMAYMTDLGVSIAVLLNKGDYDCKAAVSRSLAQVVLDHLSG